MPSAIGMTAAQYALFEALLADGAAKAKAQCYAEDEARRAAKLAQRIGLAKTISITPPAPAELRGDYGAQSPPHPSSHPVGSTKRPPDETREPPASPSDSNSPGAGSLPIGKRNRSQGGMSPNSSPSDTAAVTSPLALPEWYHSVNKDAKHPRSQVYKLKEIRDAIDKCRKTSESDLSQTFEKLREAIHDAEFRKVDAVIVRNTRLLESNLGLPLIFNNDTLRYPFDIAADSKELWTKWCRQVFDPDLLRGIRNGSKKGRRTDSLVPNYPGRVAPDQFGNVELVNGQWWPSQLATLRDGAHGSAQAGIYGKKAEGAYSVVLAGGHHTGGKYDDIDEGDVIWYCGTDGENGQVSEGTQRLLESVHKYPVRVLRSHNLPQQNPYRPERGYRYDGLYEVVEFEVVDPSKQAHRFHLIRQPGQDPIRTKALGKAARPTAQEIAEYENIRSLLASMGEKL